jgi:hypothetical protein
MEPIEHEWKRGTAELLILSLLEGQPRHGYDIGKLIELRSGGALRFTLRRSICRGRSTASARPIR